MKIIRFSCILLVTLLFAAASVVMADGFSCGSRIVTTGDRKYDVLRKCGEPSHVEVRGEVRIKRDFGPSLSATQTGLHRRPLFVEELVTVEEWEYNFGSTRFIRYLQFEKGRLTSITEGDYGY
ncbi:MAG: DUF2845 domain-containing protein [Deltaproteobacteria bacterium]